MTAITYGIVGYFDQRLDEPGFTMASNIVQRTLAEAFERFHSAEIFSLNIQLLEDLNSVVERASVPNWDGYDAEPVNIAAFIEARRFIRRLAFSAPMPEILSDPDGDITLQWIREPDRQLSVSLSGTGRVSYAGLFGKGIRAHGTEVFNAAIPQEIIRKLRRLYPEASV